MKILFKNIILKILKFQAQCVLRKYKPKIITITGSVGKTSTKDAIYVALSSFYHVRKSDKSYNSQIGLPLTVLGIPNGWNDPLIWLSNIIKGFQLIFFTQKYPEWLVLEVGVGKPGDMKETAMWLKSDIVVITAIGDVPVHVEFFESREHLIKEKSGLISTLKKDGILIVNKDDQDVLNMSKNTKNKVFTYGFDVDADLLSQKEKISYTEIQSDTKNTKEDSPIYFPLGISFDVRFNENNFAVIREGVFGKNHVYSTLSALAVVVVLGLDIEKSIKALRDYEVPPGRMKILLGKNNSIIIDDTYNSSPFASELALNTLGQIQHINRKIAVLGDMLELGRHTEDSHKSIGKIAKENVDILIVVGPRAKYIKIGAIDNGMKEENVFEFNDSVLAGEFLKDFITTGDAVLVKGSQGVRMEKAVFSILKNVEKQAKYLVRQEKEWLER